MPTAADRAIGRQHQAAIDAGQPWPPQRQAAPDTEPQPQDSGPAQPGVPKPRPEHEEPEALSRFDQDIDRASQATRRIRAQRAELDASAEYLARVGRNAEATAERQPGTPEHADLELG